MIKASNLTKYYGLTKALDSFSLEVQKGKVFALLGQMVPVKRHSSNAYLD